MHLLNEAFPLFASNPNLYTCAEDWEGFQSLDDWEPRPSLCRVPCHFFAESEQRIRLELTQRSAIREVHRCAQYLPLDQFASCLGTKILWDDSKQVAKAESLKRPRSS